MRHEVPCEELERTQLELGRLETDFKAQKKINWAIWAPIIGTLLSGAFALATSFVSDRLTKKAAETADVVARKACQDMMISTNAAFLNGVQAGRREAEIQAEKDKLSNIPPIVPIISPQTLIVRKKR